MTTNVILGLIFALLAVNSFVFWSLWWPDYCQRKADIEHTLRLITTLRRARTAEDINALLDEELAEAMRLHRRKRRTATWPVHKEQEQP